MAWHDRLKDRMPRLHRFLTRDDRPWPMVRQWLGGALFILLLLGVLWTVTGQPLGQSPVVVVESGSMMHCANGVGYQGSTCEAQRFGRIGTIDPGDLIFVKDIDRASDVDTRAGGGRGHYGEDGDVIVFQPGGAADRTPIIHRAIFYLEIHGPRDFSIRELGLEHIDSLDDPRIEEAIAGRHGGASMGWAEAVERSCTRPEESGFITMGDNNGLVDQGGSLGTGITAARCPVQVDWILGKARGEVPWIGLIKLKFSDILQGSNNYRNSPEDVRTMMWVTLIVIIGGPFAFDFVMRRRARRKAEAAVEEEVARAGDDAQGPADGGDLDEQDGPR